MFIRSGGGGAEREEPKWEGAEPTRGRGGQSKGRRPPADLEQVDSFSLIISFFLFFWGNFWSFSSNVEVCLMKENQRVSGPPSRWRGAAPLVNR